MTTKKEVMVLPESSVQIGSPQKLMEFATTLKQFIVNEELFTQIKGKNYVHVEGWQFAGTSMGIVPIVKSNDRVSEIEIKYSAHVELKNLATGEIVGAGFAICSKKESKKEGFDEYAIASMAQTRAIGKAYRNLIGWVIKLAGYEGTTAEEMSGVADDTEESQKNTDTENDKKNRRDAIGLVLPKMTALERSKLVKAHIGVHALKDDYVFSDTEIAMLYDYFKKIKKAENELAKN